MFSSMKALLAVRNLRRSGDRDVMEVVIDLESKPDNLPIGLRVSVLFYDQQAGIRAALRPATD